MLFLFLPLEKFAYTWYNQIDDKLNSFRYRGYYFDLETGLYYLQSRYYDPQVGRFISIDSIKYLAPQTLNGLNLYAYCNNNPVMRLDPSGYVWWLIGATIGFIATVISDFDDDKKIFNRSKTLSDYSYNATLGVGLNFITTVLGLEVGVVAYGASAFAELIATSFLDKSDVKYNGKKEIKNSYKVLGIGDKVKYIRENNISENTGMSEFALWFEWTYHNIAYYLDIFGILREHSRDVNFG